MIQKVENSTQTLSFKRMISDKGHLRLSPQDFPIGSAFRCFSAFGPADSVTLLREAGWIARMGWSDCEGTLILLTVDVLLKPWRFNVFTSNSWLEPNRRSFKERFVKKSQNANNFSRAKKKELWQSTAFSKMALSLLSLGSSPFFSIASMKAYARLRDFDSSSDSFQLRSRILHRLEVQMSNGLGGARLTHVMAWPCITGGHSLWLWGQTPPS